MAVTDLPASKDTGCKEGETKRESDLCAQWEAADASRKAANYSFWAVLISAVGTGFLFYTFLEQRRTARAELRAYLFLETSTLYDGRHASLIGSNEEGTPYAHFTIKNFGSTPAHDVRNWAQFVLLPPGAEPPEPRMSDCAVSGYAPESTQIFWRPLVVDPFQAEMDNAYCLTQDQIAEINRGEIYLTLFGRITYKDVFGRSRKTNYRLFYTGRWPPRENSGLRYSATGNAST